jgi:hypothetical protein
MTRLVRLHTIGNGHSERAVEWKAFVMFLNPDAIASAVQGRLTMPGWGPCTALNLTNGTVWIVRGPLEEVLAKLGVLPETVPAVDSEGNATVAERVE